MFTTDPLLHENMILAPNNHNTTSHSPENLIYIVKICFKCTVIFTALFGCGLRQQFSGSKTCSTGKKGITDNIGQTQINLVYRFVLYFIPCVEIYINESCLIS